MSHMQVTEYKMEMFHEHKSSLLWNQCPHVCNLETLYINLAESLS